MKKQLSKGLVTVIALLLCFNIFTIFVSAKSIDTQKTSSLEIVYRHNNVSYENLEVKIYRIASVQGNYNFELDAPFKNYRIDINDVKSQEEWRSLALTLSSYAIADNLKPTAIQTTDADGVVKFEDLRPGMYLTMSIQKKVGSDIVNFESFMTVIPYPNDDGQSYLYDLTVYPKCRIVTPSEDKITYKVVKQWRDDRDPERRPDSVTIKIYKNGIFAENVTLSDENNWMYSWVADNDGAEWRAVEYGVPNGYFVRLTEKDNFIIVLNSSDVFSEEPPETTTNTSSVPTTEPPSQDFDSPETTTNTSSVPTTEPPPYETDPPQTGDTSSPELYITIMCIAGFVIILLSLEKKKINNEKNKDHIS